MDTIDLFLIGMGLGAMVIAIVMIPVALLARRKRWAMHDKMVAEAMEPPEPIQKYDRFPEPKPYNYDRRHQGVSGPTKTVETRDGSDVPF